jgi:arylsulfatase A-like enzyme
MATHQPGAARIEHRDARGVPRSLSACLVAVGCLVAGCSRDNEDVPALPRPNVLLVVIDTLRADRLSCAGYSRPTTPNLDALAARGVRFTHVSAPRAKTTPSMATVMTGLYPHDHGVRDLTSPFDGRATTLAEAFAARGWSTAAIIGNYVLTRALAGLDRGFARWIEDLPDTNGVPPDDVPQRRATSLTDEALTLLTGPEPLAGPWFVWLHYMDPHGAYDAPREHQLFESTTRDLVPDPERPPPRGRQHWIAEYNVLPEERFEGRIDAQAVRDRYDAEIHYVDAELGRLCATLDERGLTQNTWIIVLSDHGESLGENHYWFEHGRNAYEASIRVPLLIVPPTSAPTTPGVRNADLSLADLFPTLLELANIDPLPMQELVPTGPHGRSRAALLTSDSTDLHPVFCEKLERVDLVGALQTKSVRIGDWKLLRHFTRADAGLRPLHEELYDLSSDPYESNDLASSPPGAAPLPTLRAALLDFVTADTELAEIAQILADERATLERDQPEVLRRLRALGY